MEFILSSSRAAPPRPPPRPHTHRRKFPAPLNLIVRNTARAANSCIRICDMVAGLDSSGPSDKPNLLTPHQLERASYASLYYLV